jgi:hypothetical protein
MAGSSGRIFGASILLSQSKNSCFNKIMRLRNTVLFLHHKSPLYSFASGYVWLVFRTWWLGARFCCVSSAPDPPVRDDTSFLFRDNNFRNIVAIHTSPTRASPEIPVIIITVPYHLYQFLYSKYQGCGSGLIQFGSGILAQSGFRSGYKLKQNFGRQFLSQIFLK